ncbi:DUF350 domain-containing protein [Marinagarivorans algicola]|uniref:DUF350 domain-containing protein n=1 Tax=Marinagarivorans algicola TaxID=1513270 RepID=UPI0006B45F49|nr:DUF350 domain-containing protein [Marinagarivorans algicola]
MLIWQIAVVCINVVLALAALIGLRYGMSALIGVHVKDELDKKDNIAFGIIIAGAVLALMLIMSGAMSGDAHASLMQEALNVSMYGVLGIVLLKVGFLVQDKLLLRKICIRDEIKKGNSAVAIAAAANLIAVGVVIRTSITWVEDDSVNGLLPVALVFIALQIILAAVTLLRTVIFSKRNPDNTWQSAIQSNNIALAIRFSAQMLATAFALSSVAYLVNYASILLFEIVYTWLGLGLAVMLVVWLLYTLACPIVLSKINVVEEVDQQRNIGVAAIEAALFLGIATLFMGFMAH